MQAKYRRYRTPANASCAARPPGVASRRTQQCSAEALALEPSRTATSEVVAEAERACRDTKGQLSSAAVSEIAQRVRLAVIQQRANARNLERRL